MIQCGTGRQRARGQDAARRPVMRGTATPVLLRREPVLPAPAPRMPELLQPGGRKQCGMSHPTRRWMTVRAESGQAKAVRSRTALPPAQIPRRIWATPERLMPAHWPERCGRAARRLPGRRLSGVEQLTVSGGPAEVSASFPMLRQIGPLLHVRLPLCRRRQIGQPGQVNMAYFEPATAEVARRNGQRHHKAGVVVVP